MNKQEQALGRCPFCGSDQVRPESTCPEDHFVFCPSCECEGPLEMAEELAIAAWNHRAALQPAEQPTVKDSLIVGQPDDERARFEAWASTDASGWADVPKKRTQNGEYRHPGLESDWKVWQAAKRDAAKAPQDHVNGAIEMVAPQERAAVPQEVHDLIAWLLGEFGSGGMPCELLALIDRLRKAEAASKWQPIETAPRDGTYILVANDRTDLPWVAHYFPVAVSGYRFELPWRSVMLNCDHIRKDVRYLPPTCWQPLPAAPDSTPTDSAENDKP